MWAGDKLIQAKKTTRPPYIESHVWSYSISDAMRKAIAAEYEAQRPLVEAARSEAGISEFLDPDDSKAEKIIEAARRKLFLPAAPAMPTLRVYDERLHEPPNSPFRPENNQIHHVGFVTAVGSLFRTIGTDGNYNDYDVRDGTESTTYYSGSSVRSSSCETPVSDSESSMGDGTPVPDPYHFRYHQDDYDRDTGDLTQQGDVMAEWFAMVHLPIPMKRAQTMPRANAAVNKEWDALASLPAWDLKRVKPKAQVIGEAKKAGKSFQFGSLMDLCHEKGAEFNRPDDEKIYKGRVVFRGDQVRDETGFYAVFTEQSASASHMAAIKFMDFIGRVDGNASQDSDAVKAYTQVKLDSLEELLGENVLADKWISLPRERRPKHWDNIENPVCPLLRNLHGHPLAGFIWEKHCQRSILRAGFEKIPGWECLFVHRQMRLFLSVYVDDFRMAGSKENLAPMWDILRKSLTLEDAVDSVTNTYLGCNQRKVIISNKIVNEKNDMLSRLISPVQGTSLDEDKVIAQQSFEDSQVLSEPSSSSNHQGTPVPSGQSSKAFKKKKAAAKSTNKSAVAPNCAKNGIPVPGRGLAFLPTKTGSFKGPIKAWVYDMKEHTE